jgi:hypothetical protein
MNRESSPGKNRFFHNPQRQKSARKKGPIPLAVSFFTDFQIFLRKDCLMGVKGAGGRGDIFRKCPIEPEVSNRRDSLHAKSLTGFAQRTYLDR